MTIELLILLIIGGILYVVWLIIRESVKSLLIRNFKKKVAPYFPIIDKQLGELEKLYVPTKHITDEEVDSFFKEILSTQLEVKKLYTPKPTIFNEYLDSTLCPRCLEGKMEAIKDGITANGEKYRSFVCSNRESGCDFFETKYGDLTPPGILITQMVT